MSSLKMEALHSAKHQLMKQRVASHQGPEHAVAILFFWNLHVFTFFTLKSCWIY